MGWNSGFKVMEKTVITAYDENILTSEILDKIMSPYKGTDCDSGGSQNLLSKDDLCVEEIICKIMKPEEYQKAVDNPVWIDDFEENREIYLENNNWKYIANDKLTELFNSIWRDIWKIW